jgi:hypothetical protein
MCRRIGVYLTLLAVAAGAAACATSRQWAEWRDHSSQFASGDHLVFSLRNRDGHARVSRQDLREARAQSWWGEPVVVRPDQLFGS